MIFRDDVVRAIDAAIDELNRLKNRATSSDLPDGLEWEKLANGEPAYDGLRVKARHTWCSDAAGSVDFILYRDDLERIASVWREETHSLTIVGDLGDSIQALIESHSLADGSTNRKGAELYLAWAKLLDDYAARLREAAASCGEQ